MGKAELQKRILFSVSQQTVMPYKFERGLVNMKKLTVLLLAGAMSFSLVACGGDTASNPEQDGGNSTSSSEAEYKTIQLNETVTTERFEFTLTNAEFAGKSAEITAGYTAEIMDSDKELLRCDYTIHYIGKESLNSSPVAMTVLYGDGYTFQDGRQYIVSSDGEMKETYRSTNNAATTSYVTFEPLTDTVYTGYGLMEVPETVKNETEEPLSVSIMIDGAKLLYEIR